MNEKLYEDFLDHSSEIDKLTFEIDEIARALEILGIPSGKKLAVLSSYVRSENSHMTATIDSAINAMFTDSAKAIGDTFVEILKKAEQK